MLNLYFLMRKPLLCLLSSCLLWSPTVGWRETLPKTTPAVRDSYFDEVRILRKNDDFLYYWTTLISQEFNDCFEENSTE